MYASGIGSELPGELQFSCISAFVRMKGLLFTYVLTYGGAVASLFNPFVGLLIYICFAIIKPEALWYWSVPAGNYSRIIAIALLGGWALNGFGNWKFGRGTAVVWALLGFMTWNIVSAILAPNQEVAWADVEERFKIVLPFLVGITVISSVGQLKQLAWVIMLSQAYLAYEANTSYLLGFNRIKEAGFGAGDNNCAAIAMVCGAGFAFFLGLSAQRWWARWLAFLASGLMAHSVMLAESRGGMLAMIITGATSFLLVRKRPVYYAYLLLGVAVAWRLAGPSVLQRFGTAFAAEGERDASAQSRLELWQNCLQIVQQNPITGVGPHHFPLIAQEFGWTAGKEAHSLWLQTGAELGIPALGFLLGFYVLTIVRLWRLAQQLDSLAPDVADACRMVVAALIGFMIAAQFVSLVGLEIPYYITLVGVGYLKLADSFLPADVQTQCEPALVPY